MYCPKCATQNAEDTKFCRSCGTNLSLVPQALTGRLPEAPSGRRRHRGRNFEHGGHASLANGITKFFVGLGFLIVSFALALSSVGRGWWFWMLIPAFASLGKGVAQIVSAKYGPNVTQGLNQMAIPPVAQTGGSSLAMKCTIHRPALPNKRRGNSILRPTRIDIETPISTKSESTVALLIPGYARS
jgi:hypothetical protein